jgi:hypothetical protein
VDMLIIHIIVSFLSSPQKKTIIIVIVFNSYYKYNINYLKNHYFHLRIA